MMKQWASWFFSYVYTEMSYSHKGKCWSLLKLIFCTVLNFRMFYCETVMSFVWVQNYVFCWKSLILCDNGNCELKILKIIWFSWFSIIVWMHFDFMCFLYLPSLINPKKKSFKRFYKTDFKKRRRFVSSVVFF